MLELANIDVNMHCTTRTNRLANIHTNIHKYIR